MNSKEGEEGGRMEAGVNNESVPSDSERLCLVCKSVYFQATVPYGSVFDGRTKFHRQLLKLPEVLARSEECFLCRKIVEFFHEWSGLKFGNQGPDLESVSAGLHMFFLDRKDDELDNHKAGLVRLEVFLIVPNPSDELRPYEPVLQFQRCSQPPLNVEDFCNGGSLFDWESGEDEAYSGRIRPLVADTQLFRKWKETCCDIHGTHCNSIFKSGRQLIPRLRLVDVEERCVVDCEDDRSYTALSYVWGKAVLPMLTKSTYKNFRQVESLNRDMLPKTIADAIEVTKTLGERYIWVDCLCIIQDDDADKREFIPQMDLIFGVASVTIVAASGVNADAGLPGITLGLRTCRQEPFKINGISFLRTLDTGRFYDKPSYLAGSEWYKRGWTFQEKIFSRRALIFTLEQVYWECQKATWCEDSLWETMKPPTVYRHCFAEEDFRHPWPSDVDSLKRIYTKLIGEYSGRKLTYESDGLDAFEGILNAFRKKAGLDFLCALPTSSLSNALIWSCFETMPRRRKDEKRRSSDDTIGCRFPSWSWVGWVGQVHWHLYWQFLRMRTQLDLIFYYLDDHCSLKQVEAVPTQSSSQMFVKEEADKTNVTLDDIPNTVLRRSIPQSILFFWSSTAKLVVKHGEDPNQPPILCHNVKVGPTWTIEPLWLHAPYSFPPELVESGEFVVIGRYPLKDRVAVLYLSEENEDGVVYRRGLVCLGFSDWIDLPRQWKMISLG